MELDRKEFHFDLDINALKQHYSRNGDSSWNAAWSDIREVLEEHGFEKPQYSGYESKSAMSYLEAYHAIDVLSDNLPWFKECVKAATFTEIGESYNVKECLENGLQLSLKLRPETRKEFHFDFGNRLLQANYPSLSDTAWRGAWTLVRRFMEKNGFTHTQYSGYESMGALPMEQAVSVMRRLQERYPWFKDSLLAASVTEVGERHDALEYIKASRGLEMQPPSISHEQEEPSFFASEIADMRKASQALSGTRGSEPPKDIDIEH